MDDAVIRLVGIGAMTRMIAEAYPIADSIRAVDVPVVMGGPPVTELADEPLGLDVGPRPADAVALGEADETWQLICFRMRWCHSSIVEIVNSGGEG